MYGPFPSIATVLATLLTSTKQLDWIQVFGILGFWTTSSMSHITTPYSFTPIKEGGTTPRAKWVLKRWREIFSKNSMELVSMHYVLKVGHVQFFSSLGWAQERWIWICCGLVVVFAHMFLIMVLDGVPNVLMCVLQI